MQSDCGTGMRTQFIPRTYIKQNKTSKQKLGTMHVPVILVLGRQASPWGSLATHLAYFISSQPDERPFIKTQADGS